MMLFLGLLIAGCKDPGHDSRPQYTAGETGIDTFSDTAPETDGDTNDSSKDTNDSDTAVTLSMPENITRVILVVMDTTRWDTAKDPSVMPWLSSAIKSGVDFDNSWGSGNWTRPTVPAILTGVPGFSLGESTYRDENVPQIPDEVPTLGERFGGAGWSTRADLCNSVARDSEGARGFASLEVCEHPERNDATALQQLQRSAEWLDEVGDNAFLWLQVMESHDPFNRPAKECWEDAKALANECPGWTGMIEGNGGAWWNVNDTNVDTACKAAIVAAYNCDTVQLDHDLRDGFAELDDMGLLDNAVVLFTVDHGENILEPHGEGMNTALAHHREMYAQVSRVPMAMWWKNVKPTRVSNPIGHADVAPTLLNAVGFNYEDDIIEGESAFDIANTNEAMSRIVTQFACDAGGTWNGAAYTVDGTTYHTMAFHSFERADLDDRWTTYNASTDPAETTPLEDFTVPDEVRNVLENQIATSATWTCN